MSLFWKTLRALALSAPLSLGMFVQSSYAQQDVMRIAAIVNDDLISVYDLQNRVRWVVFTSGIKPDAAGQRRIVRQVLDELIFERLRIQEADRLNVRVTEREIDQQLEAQAQRNNLSKDGLVSRVQSVGIDPSTVRSQIRANIAWNKLASRQLRRQVDVSEDEIDRELEELREALSEPQKRLQEIFLNLDSDTDEAEVFRNAERIVQQARDGVDFAKLARAFSQNRTAQNGGSLGWIAASQLSDETAPVFEQLRPGQTSEPIRTIAGILILHVSEERASGVAAGDAQVDLYQIALPIQQSNDTAQRDSAISLLEEIRPAITSCGTAEEIAGQIEGAKGNQINGVRVATMPDILKNELAVLQKDETSRPVALPRSVLIATVCERDDAGAALPSRGDILNRIGSERMELLARRYLRDLRREAFIDVRL